MDKLSERMRKWCEAADAGYSPMVSIYAGDLHLLADEVAQLEEENEAYEWFIKRIPLRQFCDVIKNIPEEYRKAFVLTQEEKALEAGGE